MMKSLALGIMILFVILVLGGCDFGPSLPTATPLPSPNPTAVATPTEEATATPFVPALSPTPLINSLHFTREQFDQAWALWQAQGIEEYEMTVYYVAYSALMARWTLHIRVTDEGNEILSYVRDPSSPVPPTDGLGAPQWLPTAEPEITGLKSYLQSLTIESEFAELRYLLDHPDSERLSAVDYYVSFEATQGYPVQVHAIDKPFVADAGYKLDVLKFEVLKRKSAATRP